MKKSLTLVLFLLISNLFAQHKITFEYDIAGNQIKREVCFGCTARLAKSTETKIERTETEKTQNPVVESNDYIKYFPNPVVDELNINWDLLKSSEIVEMLIYNSAGMQVYKTKIQEKNTNTVISFQSYPQGIYFVELLHNNGNINTIRVIKKQ